MDHDDDGETSYNTFVDDVAFEPTYLQALLTAAGRNVATKYEQKHDVWCKTSWDLHTSIFTHRNKYKFKLENDQNTTSP